MFRKLTPLFGVFGLCCGQLATAEDSKNDLDFNITPDINLYTIFGRVPSCQKGPEGGSLFGAAVCIVTPGVDDPLFEQYPDLGIYNTNKAEDLVNQFKPNELERRYGKDGEKVKAEYCAKRGINPGPYCKSALNSLYNEKTSTGVFRLNFRGLTIFASFPYPMGENGKDGTTLVFSINEKDLKISKIFTGKNREDSVDQLKDYLKKDGNAILSKLAEISPNSVADAQKDIIKRDFDIGTGFNNKQDTPVAEDTSVKDTSSILRVGAGYSKYEYDNDETVKFISLPLSVSIPLGSEQELILRLPLQYSETYGKNRALGAARAYQIAGGISYKTPVAYPNNPNASHRWFLTPSFSYGLVGSKDMASVAQLVSTSVTSDLLLVDRPNYSVSMGNLIGYQKTLPLEYRGWKVTTERENVVTRNGILVSVPLSSLMSGKLLGKDLVAEFFVTDTRAFGDPMYEDHYNEIGFTIGPKDGEGNFVNISRQQFGLGLGFQYHLSSVAKNGFGFSMSYKF